MRAELRRSPQRRRRQQPSFVAAATLLLLLLVLLSGAAAVVVVVVVRGQTWSPAAFLKANNADGDDELGWSVSVSGSRIAVGAYQKASCSLGPHSLGDAGNQCVEAGAVYVYELDSSSDLWVQTAYLKASNTGAADSFGYSVSLDGDRLAVGAIGENSCSQGVGGAQTNIGCDNSGAVYVFEYSALQQRWEQTEYLKASNTGDYDQFGVSVSLDGDRLAVSAPGEASCSNELDDSCPLAGAVYVFDYDPTSGAWLPPVYVKPDVIDDGDFFGWLVRVEANRLAVVSINENSCATGVNGNALNNLCVGSGAVYIFDRDASTGAWLQRAYLKASNSETDIVFGYGMSLSQDQVAVGAPFERSCATGVGGNQGNTACNHAGAVYVFQADQDGLWSQSAYLKASNSNTDDQFGWSVSLDQDRLAVGAWYEASCATGVGADQTSNACQAAGAVYLFERHPQQGWAQTTYIKAPQVAEADDNFGYNLDLDGNHLVVSATGEDSCWFGSQGEPSDDSCADAGAAYLFTVPPTPPSAPPGSTTTAATPSSSPPTTTTTTVESTSGEVEDGTGDGDGENDGGAGGDTELLIPIIAVVAALLLVVVCLALVAAFVVRRRKKGGEGEDESQSSAGAAEGGDVVYCAAPPVHNSGGTDSPIYNTLPDADSPVYNTTDDIRANAAQSNYQAL